MAITPLTNLKSAITICIALIVLFSSLFGCAPEHENPFDPESAFFSDNGFLTGTVQTYYPPHNGLSNVTLTLTPGNWSVRSNQSGGFKFMGIPAGGYVLTAHHDIYSTDSTAVSISRLDTTNVTVQLIGLPVFSGAANHTRFYDQWWPDPQYEIHFQVKVQDADGPADVDSVFVEIPRYAIHQPMIFNPTEDYYERTIFEVDLDTTTISELSGTPIYFHAKDLAGKENTSSALYISRIIDETPIPLTPVDGDTTALDPLLHWAPQDYRFPVTQYLHLYRTINSVPTLVWESGPLISYAESDSVETTLVPGLYYWTITAVDEYGNLGRSKEARFIARDESYGQN